MGGITKTITLTLEQWERLKNALALYEYAATEFMDFKEGQRFREEYIMPVYNQIPDEVF